MSRSTGFLCITANEGGLTDDFRKRLTAQSLGGRTPWVREAPLKASDCLIGLAQGNVPR